MENEKMFTELSHEEQKLILDEIFRLKITCEPKKMKASELYALIDNAEKTSDQKSENADDTVTGIDNSTQEQKLEGDTSVTDDAKNSDDIQVKISETEIKPETPCKQPVKKSKKDQGLCISCYSKVYDGVCCGCGRCY